MYHYKLGINAQEHDNFVIASPQTNLLQSSAWAKIKDNWGNERVGFYKDEQLVAVASILIRPLPLGFSMFYIPRGPIMDYTDQELAAFVLKSLKKIGKEKKALFIKFDPSLFLTKAGVDQERTDQTETLSIIDTLTQQSAKWVGRTDQLDDTIQPRFHANLYRELFDESHFSKNTRQTIRTARNKDIQILFGALDLLDDFANLMKKTENRKSIHLRGKDYYQKLLETYKDSSYITLARLDINERLSKLQKELEKAQTEASRFTDKTKPGKIETNKQNQERLQEEIEFLTEKQQQGLHIIPLAGTLSLEFGGTSENIYAGMDEEYRRYQPALLTWYETAQHAFERGATWQNMGGIENNMDGGLYHFKSKFQPIIEEYAGEFNLPTSPLYALFNLAYTLRKKMKKRS
ncbi:aminoacyltransferase [Streptococcus pneumoniae]